MMPNKDLERKVQDYKDGKVGYDEMFDAIHGLAEHALNHLNFKFDFNKENALLEAAEVCMAKIDRYDCDKGRAFNFFITICLCSIRQSTRPAWNYEKLKSKYKDHVKNKVS